MDALLTMWDKENRLVADPNSFSQVSSFLCLGEYNPLSRMQTDICISHLVSFLFISSTLLSNLDGVFFMAPLLACFFVTCSLVLFLLFPRVIESENFAILIFLLSAAHLNLVACPAHVHYNNLCLLTSTD